MTGMEYGPEWLLAIVALAVALCFLFARIVPRERELYERQGERAKPDTWSDWRDLGIRRLLDEVEAEHDVEIRELRIVRPYDRERDDR